MNNENPCNPMECYDGLWAEIIIDRPEQEGVPCVGGEYVDPDEGECCYLCVACNGDLNSDDAINILDIVTLVNIVLGIGASTPFADLTGDGSENILDISTLVVIVLNPSQEDSDTSEFDIF